VVADLVRAVVFPAPGTVSDRLLSALVAAAFACAAGLLMRRNAVLAWSAATAAVGLAALDFVGFAQAARVANDVGAWQLRLGVANVCLVAAAVVAVATVRTALPMLGAIERRVLRMTMPIGLMIVVFYAITALGHSIVPDTDGLPDATWLRWSGRVTLIVVAIALLAGAMASLRAPFGRARVAASSAGSADGRGDRLGRFLRAFGDELLASATRRRVADEERARIAADLHARVLPDLRRAAAAAGDGAVPASVSAGLRAAVSEVQTLIEGRESLVLDEFGLVAALEWLAERTEERSPLEVTIDLDDKAAVDRNLAIPRETARAVFRVALLAVDNAVRHASASHLAIELRLDPGIGTLVISDDGRGFDPASSQHQGGRGIRDMRAAAATIHGTVVIEPGAPGTRIALTWPHKAIAGSSATRPRADTDSGGATAT
jgi:signal transduction histidine kinase